MSKIIVGTRGSKLAQAQTTMFVQKLKDAFPGLKVEIKVIKTEGDKLLTASLSVIGGKGVFTKELEDALLTGKIDFAVHSLKDLPAELPSGLSVGAYLERGLPNDIIITKSKSGLSDLPSRAVVATGSLRRALQLKKIRPDIVVQDIRGNIETRLKKFRESSWDAIVLAYTALERLGMEDLISEILPPETMLPAVGQGIVGVECRDEENSLKLLTSINHRETELCAVAERTFLEALGGGCQVPLAGHACVNGKNISLSGLYMPEDGKYYLSDSTTGNVENPAETGALLAKNILQKYFQLNPGAKR